MTTVIRGLLWLVLCWVATVVTIVTPGEALAYLDPGTGSAVIQMVVAGVMGALFVVKMYWRKLVAYFGGGAQESQQAEPKAATDEQE
jgi:hypothetical protein